VPAADRGELPAAANRDQDMGRQRPEYALPPYNRLHVSLDVLADGRPLPTVWHAGKTYLPVPRLGMEYALRVWNHGSRRITAVVSVDGLSVISGQPASADQPGYLVDPRSHILIKGWRRNLEVVAAFSFEPRDQSYASRLGHPENIGVIGLVAFEELTRGPRPLREQPRAAKSFQRASGAVGDTGTGYGRDVDSLVYEVPFLRSANTQTITVYYDTAEALRRAGVPVPDALPVPFPHHGEFAPPPGDPRK
jgi:hypothetical protein